MNKIKLVITFEMETNEKFENIQAILAPTAREFGYTVISSEFDQSTMTIYATIDTVTRITSNQPGQMMNDTI